MNLENAMNIALQSGTLQLAHGDTVRLSDTACVKLSAVAGALWVTSDGSILDLVLEPGQTKAMPSRGTTISALEPSVVRFEPVDCAPGVAPKSRVTANAPLHALAKFAHTIREAFAHRYMNWATRSAFLRTSQQPLI
jgi:hypothetical protein